MMDEEEIDTNPSNQKIMEVLTQILRAQQSLSNSQQTMSDDITEVKNRLIILENTTDNTQNEVNDLRESINNGDNSKIIKHKRDSVLGSIAENISTKTSKNNNSFLKVEPDASHIRLKYLTVASAEKFWRQIEEHERINRGVTLNAVDHIEENVIQLLLAKAPRLTLNDFYFQQNEYIAGLIQEVLTPVDRATYLKTLSTYLVFRIETKGPYEPSASNYGPLYLAMQVYRRQFEAVYDIITTKFNKKLLPRCNDKPDGLIHIFTSKIPWKHGKLLHQNFPSEKKWTDIKEYVNDFMEETLKLHDQYLSTKAFNNLMDKSESYVMDKTDYLKSNTSNLTPQKKKYDNTKSLSYIQGNDSQLSFETIFDEDEGMNQSNIYLNDAEEDHEVYMENPVRRSRVETLSAFQGQSTPYKKVTQHAEDKKVTFDKPNARGGCWKLISEGECPGRFNKSCPFEHDNRAVLEETHTILLNKLLKSQYGKTNLRRPTLSQLEDLEEDTPT